MIFSCVGSIDFIMPHKHKKSSSSTNNNAPPPSPPPQPYVWSQVVQKNVPKGSSSKSVTTKDDGHVGASGSSSTNKGRGQQKQQKHQHSPKKDGQSRQQRHQRKQQQQQHQQQHQQQQQQKEQLHQIQEDDNYHHDHVNNAMPTQPQSSWNSPPTMWTNNNGSNNGNNNGPMTPSQPNGQQPNGPNGQQQFTPQQHQQQHPRPLNTDQYSYQWDPQNAQRFLAARAAMLRAIFSPANATNPLDHSYNSYNTHNNRSVSHGGNVNTNGQHPQLPTVNFQRSHSDQLPFTSPTRPMDGKKQYKQYARAASADAMGAKHPRPTYPPPSLPSLNSSQRSLSSGGNGRPVSVERATSGGAVAGTARTLPGGLSGVSGASGGPSRLGGGFASSDNLNLSNLNVTTNRPANPGDPNPPSIDPAATSEEDSTTAILDEILPLKQDYFSHALRLLLMDTPLPLSFAPPAHRGLLAVVVPHPSPSASKLVASSAPPTNGAADVVEVRPREMRGEEEAYLIPRAWMGKWCHWARCRIVIGSVEGWFCHWARYDAQFENGSVAGGSFRGSIHGSLNGGYNGSNGRSPERGGANGASGANGSRSGSNDNSRANDPPLPKRVFSFLPEMLKALAALSILGDQYQLHENTERDWMEWMQGMETCWIHWNEQQQHRHHTTNRHPNNNDTKKNHGDHPHRRALGRTEIPPYPQFAFPFFAPPGPVDGRMLSSPRRPLAMHRHVALSMRGHPSVPNAAIDDGDSDYPDDDYDEDDVLTPSEEADDALVMEFVDSLASYDPYDATAPIPRRVAACPVPRGFYEFARGAHGVRCDGDSNRAGDGRSGGSDGGAMGGSGGNGNGNGCLLFHDQWEVDSEGDPVRNCPGNGVQRGYGENAGGHGNNGHTNNSSTSSRHSRPIEFRRRILTVPKYNKESEGSEISNNNNNNNNNNHNAWGSRGGTSNQNVVTSPYSKLMQEAKKSQSEKVKEASGSSSIGGNGGTSKNGGANGRRLTVDTSGGPNDNRAGDENDTGCVVEVFPVEFRYTIVGGTTSSIDSDNDDVPRTRGMALASRASPALSVLRDLSAAASPVTPDRPASCTRLWRRSPADHRSADVVPTRNIAGERRRGWGATVGGDGYDLLDMEGLVAGDRGAGSPKRSKGKGAGVVGSPTAAGNRLKVQDAPTVEQWLGLEEMAIVRGGLRSSGPVVVELLIEVRPSPSSSWEREPLELGNRLQVGDYVDAQDSARKWYEAIVREVTPETVKVHYFGWGSRWDTDLPRMKGINPKLNPPAPLWTKTARWREQIKVGDEVEIRESTSMVQRPKWHRATVLAVGKATDPPRELEGTAELEVLEDNGAGKKVPLKLLKRKRQILVEVPQEIHNYTATPLTPPPIQNTNSLDGRVETIPAAQPPFRRWVDLYGEEICKVNTHKTAKKQTNSPATLNYTMESQRKPVEVMKPFNNIHGSGFVRESLRGIPPAPGTVGLHNLGNSCYMNSILQCINHIKPITQYFLKGEYLKEVNKNNPLGSGGRIATAYSSFLSDIWTGEFSILAPRLLKQTVSCFAPQFNNNYQHDSQEFCQYLMDGLHEDLNRVKTKPYVEQMEANGMEDSKAAMESWKKHLLRHDSIFVDHTQGMHRSHLTCPSCGKESIKFDVYSSISLPLVPAKNRPSIPLKDCLDQFAAGEQLDEQNAWYCSSCKKHVCALKLITLWNTPDVLVLHLKRFTFEKCPTVDGRLIRRKIEERVDFPIDRLDLSPYVLGPKDPEAPPIYKLFGVSEHTGTTANSGHYTATVRNSEDGNWYRHNDSAVGTTSGDAAMTGGAYLLFYQRAKGSMRWAGMEKQILLEEQRKRDGGGPNGSVAAAVEDADGFREVTNKKKKKKPFS